MAETRPKTPRAKFVCHACNVRKKACNKALPACSFCAARNLQCRYDATPLNKKGQRKYNPGRNFVALDPPSPPWSASASATNTSISSHVPVPGPTSLEHTDIYSFGRPFKQQVSSVLKLVGRTLEDVSDYYFRKFHQEYPIISPELFMRELAQYSRGTDAPANDFSILLLAMCLVTALPCLDRPLKLSSASREWLYTTTKSLFAQAHATVSNSLALVQAAFLITVCEYACARPQAAYVSINTCHLLVETLGIKQVTLDTSTTTQYFYGNRKVETIRQNLASAIGSFERLILIELDFIKSPPRTECPKIQSWVPVQMPLNYGSQGEPPISPASSNVIPTNNTLFESQAQVISLLDLILRTTQSVSETNKEIKLTELVELDVKVRNFLEVMMFESSKKQNSLCAPVALMIRYLFLLHRTILRILPTGDEERNRQVKTISEAALDTACEMVSDAIMLKGTRGTMPITCYYNLQDTIKWLQKSKDHTGDGTISDRLEDLLKSEEAYRGKSVF